MRVIRSLLVAFSCSALLFCSGCGSSFELVEVNGRVTEGGKPIVGASVNYHPIAKSKDNPYPGPASFGITDSEGRYRLRTFNEDRLGAVPGQHRISISLSSSDGPERDFAANPGAKYVPAKFSDGSTVVEVPSQGAAELNFDLAQQ